MSASLWAALALGAAVLAPGWACVRGLGVGTGPLERLVLAAALGRVAFAAVSLLAVHAGGAPLLVAFAAVSLLAALAAERSARRAGREAPGRPRATAADALAVGLALLAAALLVHAVVARSGLPNASGELVFFGRDSTNDPLVYGAVGLRLAELGLPLVAPFAGDWPVQGSFGHFALRAGLHLLSGASMLELSFRTLPLFDGAALTLSGAALAWRLGGGALAAGAAGVLLALGAEASFLLAPAASLFGVAVRPLDSWALFGPYLAAFNPGTAALQAWLAAALLLAGPGARGAPRGSGRPGAAAPSRAAAVAAGLLVASLFEWKVFLWAPVLAALLAVAWLATPRPARGAFRLASGVALLGSLPSLLHRLLSEVARGDETTLTVCVACLPRYLAESAWGGGDLSFALYRDFAAGDLAQPGFWLAALPATLVVAAVGLGARLAGVPQLWRGARGGDAAAGVQRWIAAGAVLGLGGALLLASPPHHLNGAQLAWAATFGLWPFVALQLERWLRARRLLPAALVAGLALPGSQLALGRLGYDAPVSLRVRPGERALLSELSALAGSRDVVLEPSMLLDPDRPSPLPALEGVPVRMSLLSAVQVLPQAEQDRRIEELAAVFAGDDAARAGAALARSGVRFVYVPAGMRLRYDPGSVMEPALRSEAGRVFRVPASPVEGP